MFTTDRRKQMPEPAYESEIEVPHWLHIESRGLAAILDHMVGGTSVTF
jgi:hypothetical protein